MIKSCKECKTNCCKFGPGPYKTLPVRKFLKGYCEPESYNTKCKALKLNGDCMLWYAESLPFECRTWICNIREYTKLELAAINELIYETN